MSVMKKIVTPSGIPLYLTTWFIACSLLQLLFVQKIQKRGLLFADQITFFAVTTLCRKPKFQSLAFGGITQGGGLTQKTFLPAFGL